MTRLTDRADMAKKNATQVKKITGKINESLRPGEEFDNDLLSCMNQLKQVPGQVSRWKKYAALCGADVALALTRTHSELARILRSTCRPLWRLPAVSLPSSTWTPSSSLLEYQILQKKNSRKRKKRKTSEKKQMNQLTSVCRVKYVNT